MKTTEQLKAMIRALCEKNPEVHINVMMSIPKIILLNEQVTIKGVYPHFFQIEESSSGVKKRHSIQYHELVTKRIEILELDMDDRDMVEQKKAGR